MIESKLALLGTGNSMGVPVIGCSCPVCSSHNARNQRLRPGALLQINEKKILIDAGPDYRMQALKHGIDNIDGFILTHAHYDHAAGIDDLRIYSINNRSIPCLMSVQTYEEIKLRFDYIFSPQKKSATLLPSFVLQLLEQARGTIEFCGIRLKYFSYEQGGMQVNGFRLGDLAYVSDIKNYPPSVIQDIYGVKTLVVSALRFTPSHLHLTVDEAVAFSKKVHAENTWFTHIAHELDHERTNAYLPANIRMGYDGLELPLTIGD